MGTISPSTLALVCIVMVFVQLGLGSYGVLVTKFAKKNHADPLVFCLARDSLAFPVLFLASYVAEKRLMIPTIRELPMFLLLGFFGMLAQTCYILGIYYVSTDIASMFQPLSVIWVCFFSVILRVESIPNMKTLHGISKVCGIFLAIVGAVLTAYGRYATKSSNTSIRNNFEIFGYVGLLVNTFSTGIYIVLQKKYIFTNHVSRFKYYPVSVTAWAYLFGSIFILIASLYYWNKPEKFTSITNDSVYPLIYAVFITSSLCYMLGAWSNMIVDSTLVSAFWPLQVFFCVILAYFVLGETLTAIELSGGVLMILALLAVLWSNYKQNSLKTEYSAMINSLSEDNIEGDSRVTESENKLV